MGLLKLLLNVNNAEGAREAIRISYRKHYRLAQARGLAPHSTALFGALGARWKMTGRVKNEVQLWGEVAPFVCMAPEIGREALAEYVLVIERPQDARVGWLREQLNSSLIDPYDSSEASEACDLAAQLFFTIPSELHWPELLRESAVQALSARVAEPTVADESHRARTAIPRSTERRVHAPHAPATSIGSGSGAKPSG